MSNLNEVKNEYLHMLKDNIIPFWLKNGLDNLTKNMAGTTQL